MKHRQIYRSLALFLAIYLPLVTVGIPLHKHYCNGQLENASLVFVSDACLEGPETEAQKACCSSDKSCHSSAPIEAQGDEKDCCETETELYKIDLTLILLKIQGADKDFDGFLCSRQLSQDLLSSGHDEIRSLKPPDLPHLFPKGKSRLIRYQQFLC